MKKILDYLLSVVYLIYFGPLLLVFDLLQRITFNLIGRNAHQKIVNLLNFFICYGWYFTGSTIDFQIETDLPDKRSIIFISNHQSTFDIPGIIWFLRRHRPLFVSKIELARGIPSISYNLRVGGAALINRKDKIQAMTEIARLADLVSERKSSVAIFPEGTRSRSGNLKEFATGGVSILLDKCPEALVVPICIENLSRFNPKGLFPLRSFTKLKWTVLAPIKRDNKSASEIVNEAREAIIKKGSFSQLP